MHTIGHTITPMGGNGHAGYSFVDDDGWRHYRYRVTIRYNGETTWLIFRTGTGWDRPPTIDEVLESVAQDLAYIHDNQITSGKDAMDELGSESLSKATKMYNALVKHYLSFKRVFGDDLTEFIDKYTGNTD